MKPPDPDQDQPLPGTPKAQRYAPQQILVRFKSGTGPATVQAVHETHQAQVVRTYRVPSNLQLVALPPELGVEQAIAQYRKNPNVLYAQPNYRYQVSEIIPGDPRFRDLWGMHNLGDFGLFDADIDAPEAWELTTGSADVILGVHDTGIDYDHEDLFENVFWNPGEIPDNRMDDDGNGFVDDVHGINAIEWTGDPRDDYGHGTHVSGTIAARGDNATGVVGVNWEARIVSCKSFDASGGGYEDAILTCMQYFLDLKTRAENPVNIIATNNSWGGGDFSQALLDAIEAHGQAGMLFAAAAGNWNMDNDRYPHYPSSYEAANIIAVAATNPWDELAWFSHYGRRSVDVGAPGEFILSSVPGGGYEFYDGTSMATPHVTGLIGLLKAFDPTLTPAALKNLVMTGGDETPGTVGRILSGRRINAFGSLTCEDRALFNRFAPAADSVVVPLGDRVNLGVLSIICDQPGTEPQTVTVLETGEVIQLVDQSGSGTFEGSFTPTDFGAFTLQFSMGDVVTVNVARNYDPAHIIDFQYRDVTGGIPLPFYDDDVVEIEAPFPIRFGDVRPGYDTMFVSSNGVLSFTEPIWFWGEPLPTPYAQTVVALLMADLFPGGGGMVTYAVLGSAPDRELVLDWAGVPMLGESGTGTFQMVFFENSPNILFNYADVDFDNPYYDYGANASVGVQISQGIARQFSYFEPSLSNEMTLFWGMGAPVAVAGPDQVVLPGTDVSLDGRDSQDYDGTISFYAWTQLSGTPVLIKGANKPLASFQAPQASGTLTFQLSVVDDEGQIGSDTIDVIVNRNPIADGGDDFQLANGLTGTLDGTGSADPDGVIVGYRWRQISGEEVALLDAETAIATFTAPATPQYLVFELVVTDEYGFTGTDYVVVQIFANEWPVAVAGPDRLVRPGDVITLDGRASHDPDGVIAHYGWEVTLCMTVAGPCFIDIIDANTATPVLEVPASTGLINVRLTVTDNAGAKASDSVTIVAFYQDPHAVITPIQGCANSGNAITLDGRASFDLDGQIVSYYWQQRAGAPVMLSNPNAPMVSFIAPNTQASLVFALTVTDDDARSSTAEITIPVNLPPVAVADASVLAALAGQTVTLDGSHSQDAATFAWVQTSGTPAALSNPGAAVTTFVAPVPAGRFEIATFALTVSDACGATATDTVSVVIVAN